MSEKNKTILMDYWIYRKKSAMKFSFKLGSLTKVDDKWETESPTIFVSGYFKEEDMKIKQDSETKIALTPEEMFELFHAFENGSSTKVVHDSSKRNGGEKSISSFESGINQIGNKDYYLWRVQKGQNQISVNPSIGEIRMLQNIVNHLVSLSYTANI